MEIERGSKYESNQINELFSEVNKFIKENEPLCNSLKQNWEKLNSKFDSIRKIIEIDEEINLLLLK